MRLVGARTARACLAAALVIAGAAPLLSQAVNDLAYARTPPPFVELYHEVLRPGASFASYSALEDSAAEVCRRLACPHPYLGLMSLSVPTEVLYLNLFESQRDIDRVGVLYAKIPNLNAEMERFVKVKAPLVEASNEFARLSPNGPGGWALAGAHFVVVSSPATPDRGVATFSVPGGATYGILFARTRAEADSAIRRIGRRARLLAIKPAWSLMDASWTK